MFFYRLKIITCYLLVRKIDEVAKLIHNASNLEIFKTKIHIYKDYDSVSEIMTQDDPSKTYASRILKVLAGGD